MDKELIHFNKAKYELADIESQIAKNLERKRLIKGLGLKVANSKKSKPSKNGFVYFIKSRDNGLIKIGWAIDPISRLKILQTGSSTALNLIGCIYGSLKAEAEIHKLMKGLKTRAEWYIADQHLLTYIKERDCRKEYGIS